MSDSLSKVFGATQHGAAVESRHKRCSSAGDKIRQGRVTAPARTGSGKVILAFEARADGCIYVVARVADVGVICRQDSGRGQRPGFTWLCFLPEQRRAPQFAETLDKAKDAMRSAVETWCDAAGLVARGKHPHRHPGQVNGWRAEDGA
jgi:hypothetical protein